MAVKFVNSKRELQAIAESEFEVRDDWHEPDEQNVTCTLQDRASFDNAFNDDSEKHIVISDGRKKYAVNLANLLAWATFHSD